VYPQVRANYTVDSAAVCYPYTHQFTSTTENASYYNWDFGDGTGSNIETPTHQFENFNNITDESFDIRLIARSQYNCYDSVTGQVAVYAKPDAEFSFPVTVDCPPFEAQMVNESEGFDLSYFWNFDDGSTGTDENPSHLFVNNGSTINDRLITLTVTSGGSKGCVDMASRTLRVYPNVEVALQPSITQGCTPLNVQFTGSATNVSNMLWSVDGQPFSTLANTSYRFVNQGTGDVDYNITLKGTSEYNCFNDTSVTITVFPGPVTEFYPDPLVVAYNTELDQTPVTFYNQTPFQNNWAYEWNYGDGNTDNQAANQFEYFYGDHFWGSSQNGNEVPIILKAWNNDNPECRDSVTYLIQIKPPAPQVALEENIAGCEPFTVEFNAVTKYVNDDQLNWDLGVPGAVTNELSPVYTYDEQGTYTVRLLVEGDGGSAWATRLITVHPKPEVDFSFNDSIVFVQSQNRPNEIINFYNHTKFGQVYEWYFNNNLDGGVPDLNEMNPTWHYEQLGTFYVALVANSGEGCVDTMISSIPIRVMGEASLQFPTGFFVDPAGARDEYVSDPMDPDLRIFRPYAQGVEEYKLEIYNRWGVLIFESHDVTRGWNGYLNGSPAKQDVYVWRAKGRFTNGQPFEMSGDVTLIVAPVTGVTP
jgi:PKD repeat protein